MLDGSKGSKDLSTVINSSYLAFWNSGVKLDCKKYSAKELPVLAFKLRLQAINFLLLDQSADPNVAERLSSKLCVATQAYMYAATQQNYSTIQYDLKRFYAGLVPRLYSWLHDRLHRYPAELSKCLRVIVVCQQDHLKHLNRTNCLLTEWGGVQGIWIRPDYFVDALDGNLAKASLKLLNGFGNLEKSKSSHFVYFADILQRMEMISNNNWCCVVVANLSVSFIKLICRTPEYFKKVQKSSSSILALLKYLEAVKNFVGRLQKDLGDGEALAGLCAALKADVFSIIVCLYRSVLAKEGKWRHIFSSFRPIDNQPKSLKSAPDT